LNESLKGKQYPPFTYEVGLEKIREYANAVGESERVHHDREAAKAAGFRDVVAPPMFAVVYSTGAVAPGVLDPELGIDLGRMLHGSQEFAWGEPVCANDVIETTATLRDLYEKDGREFYVLESVSRNQDGQEVVRGTWTNIVR
jgi:acyl dehydratase